jgi:prolipoprotein diacylglyceryl transferase
MEPIVLPIGPISVHAYTVFLFLALGTGAAVFFWQARKHGLNNKATMWLVIGALAGGEIGAKLSMVVFLGPQTFFTHLPELARTGMSYSGALIGGYIGVRLMERRAGIHCRCDLFALPIPLAHAVGRIGNFLAADAYGIPTTLPWGVHMAGATRHPVQLYEAALDLLLFGLLLRFRDRLPRQDDLFRLYIVGYAAIRFPLEYLRYQPTPRDVFGLTLVQHLCILGFVGCGSWLALHLYQAWSARRRLRVPAAAPLYLSEPVD